jgi:hypothetical protein
MSAPSAGDILAVVTVNAIVGVVTGVVVGLIVEVVVGFNVVVVVRVIAKVVVGVIIRVTVRVIVRVIVSVVALRLGAVGALIEFIAEQAISSSPIIIGHSQLLKRIILMRRLAGDSLKIDLSPEIL